MKRLAGQAGRTVGYLLHHTGMVLITLFFIAALGLGGFAYRLSLGPVQIPWITSRLASAVSGKGIEISIARAALTWAGYKSGGGVPLFLQLNDIVARNSAGVELVAIPTARMVFLPGALLGTSAPIEVTSSDALFPGSAVTVSLRAAIRLGFLHFSDADLNFTLGAGALGSGDMSEPISFGSFNADITPDTITLRNGRLALARVDGNVTNVSFSGQGHLQNKWQGILHVTADHLQAASLPAYWPTGLVVQTRRWVTNNITAGSASDGDFNFGLSAPADLTSLSLDSATGHFNGDDLSVGWVPKAAPITGVTGTFTLNDRDDISIAASAGTLGGLSLSAAHLNITGVSKPGTLASLSVPVSGTLAELIAVLNAPPLSLLKQAPPSLLQATGNLSGTVEANFPLKNDLKLAQVDLHVTAKVSDAAAPTPIKGLDFSNGEINATATAKALQASGTGTLEGEPASFNITSAFGPGAPVINSNLQTLAGKQLLSRIGLEAGDGQSGVTGTLPLTATINQNAAGKTTAMIHADLTPAALRLSRFGWSKQAGVSGDAEIDGYVTPDGTTMLSRVFAHAPGLDIAAAADQPRYLRFSRLDIAATAAAGTVTMPAAAGQPWRFDFTGPALDVSAMMKQASKSETEAAKPAKPAMHAAPSGPPWQADLRFDRLIMASGTTPGLHGLVFHGNGAGSVVFNADASASDDDGQPVTLVINRAAGATPEKAAPQESVRLATADAGYLLRAMGLYKNLEHGVVLLDARYSDQSDITGVVTIEKFRLLQAPVLGKILQGVTLYGVADATSGPGLVFDRLVAPFDLGPDELTLNGARAFSSSLGFTASGTIGLRDGVADLDTTIIPAYFLNAAPGKIPLIGKLFSPETGGGLFAMRAKITGPLSDPDVAVNPLSALTPGFLRDVFGLGGAKP
jgi:hypothetical protein